MVQDNEISLSVVPAVTAAPHQIMAVQESRCRTESLPMLGPAQQKEGKDGADGGTQLRRELGALNGRISSDNRLVSGY